MSSLYVYSYIILISPPGYLHVLRHNIKLNPQIAQDKLRYVDSHQFWKDQFQELYEQNIRLEEQVSHLQAVNNVDELRKTMAILHDVSLPSMYLGSPRSLKSLEKKLHNIQNGCDTSSTICGCEYHLSDESLN